MTILQWILPPLLGAGIGYLTNAIAIRMLFRPFSEKRIFGVRVPFTPGIIPRYRYDLAENIAVMVNSELMSKELLHEFLSTPHFTDELKKRLSDSISRTLDMKLGSILGVMNRFKGHALGMPEGLRETLTEGGISAVMEFLRYAEKSGIPLKRFIPFDVPELVRAAVPGLYPKLTGSLMSMVQDPQVKDLLVERARTFVDRVLHRFTVLQKFLINVGNYTVTLKNRMPEIIDDLFDALDEGLREEDMKNRVLDAAMAGIRDAVNRPLPVETLESLKTALSTGRAGVGYGPETASAAVDFIFTQRHRRVSDFLHISDEQLTGTAELAAGIVQSQILFRLEPVLETVNIRKLVTDRINALNIEEVERILLIIIEKHLAWINIFGAFLGALIGGLQLALRVFLP